MKPIDLYSLQPEKVSTEIGEIGGFYYNFIPEIAQDLWGLDNKLIEIRTYKEHYFDERRSWILSSVWYNGNPVMVIQKAGRDSCGHTKRFVTDKKSYSEMVLYIQSMLISKSDSLEKDFYDCNSDIQGLTNFYGHDFISNT